MNKYIDCPLNIKTEDITEQGLFTGWGSTFGGEPDSYGDIVEKNAFKDTLNSGGRNKNGIFPILWQHKTDTILGKWVELKETNEGLAVTGQLNLKLQKAQEAQELLKMGILFLSIGYELMRDKQGNIIENSFKYSEDKKIRYLHNLSLFEISLCTFPANINATITNVKSVIEEAKNIREFEDGLRDLGLSGKASIYIASLCKHELEKKWNGRKIEKNKEWDIIVKVLHDLNNKIH